MLFKQLIRHGVKKKKNENGFTLIEVLMALAIFSIGILAIAKLQITSVADNTSSRKYTEASTWGTSRIESVMSTAYDAASLVNGATGTIVQGIYTINWTVTDSVPIPNVKQFNVVVTWGNNKSFTANYYKAITF